MSRTPRTLAVAAILALCSTGTLAACGDDDDATGTTTTTAADAPSEDTTDEGADPGAQGGGLAAFCDPYVDTTIMLGGEPDPAALTANIALIESNAPDEVADAVTVMTDTVGQVLESGGQDPAPLQSPEFLAAQGEVDPFVFANCDFDVAVEVTGVDYGFEGLPETMSSGRNAILFTNDGAEAHEIAIMRRNDGVTEPIEELLSMPEEEAMQKVSPVGWAMAPSTGSQAMVVGDFEPGEYIAICFIPVGSTVDGDEMTEGTGDPHFAHGMQQEFTVS